MSSDDLRAAIHTGGNLCCGHGMEGGEMSRRGFLGGLGGVAAMGGLTLGEAARAGAARDAGSVAGRRLPSGKPLRLQPALMYHLDQPREKTSWRSYGGLQTPEDVRNETRRIGEDLKRLAGAAEFPIEVLPLAQVRDEGQARRVAASGADAILLFAAGGLVFSAPFLVFLGVCSSSSNRSGRAGIATSRTWWVTGMHASGRWSTHPMTPLRWSSAPRRRA